MSMHNTIDEDVTEVYRIAVTTPDPPEYVDWDHKQAWWAATAYSGRRYVSLKGVKQVYNTAKKWHDKEMKSNPNNWPVQFEIQKCKVEWHPWEPV